MNPRRVIVLVAIFLIAGIVPAQAAQPGWSTAFYRTAVDGPVEVLMPWQDGLVIGGFFNVAGPVSSPGVAYYDGETWHALGDGLRLGGVYGFCLHAGELYACGNFHYSGDQAIAGIARWDDAAWRPVGTGGPAIVEALASYDGHLYAAAMGLYRLDGSTWVREIETDAYVHQLLVDGGLLIAGGDFTQANGVAAVHVLGWDGAQVHAVYQGLDARPDGLVVHDGVLHASGRFHLSGSSDYDWVAFWNGTAWQPLGSLPTASHAYRDLDSAGGRLYLMGLRWPAGVTEALLVAWNGSDWEEICPPVADGYFRSVQTSGGWLWVGGSFDGLAGVSAPNLIRRAGAAWQAPFTGGLGLDREVRSLRAGADRLFVGGRFRYAGEQPTPLAAAWTGSDWLALADWHDLAGEPLAPTATSIVEAISPAGDRLLASGDWGGVVGGFLAEWSEVDARWDLIESTGHLALQVWRDHVYASTDEWDAGGRLVRQPLSGGDWETVGQTGANSWISALAVWNDRLIAGGTFAMITGTAAASLAAFDGSGWSSVGDGVEGSVYALVVHDGDLVVGGDFTTIGTPALHGVARFDGAVWHSLGDLQDGHVHALATYGPDLVAGGCFQQIGGVAASRIAIHDGDGWSPLGAGTDGTVMALAEYAGSLYVGGSFAAAGGVPSLNFACWTDPGTTAAPGEPDTPPLALRLGPVRPNPFNPSTTISYDLARAGAVQLTVVDLRGRLVRTLVDHDQSAGHHVAHWDGNDRHGRPAASGAYLVRLVAGGEQVVGKLLLAR